ncbi:M20 metallopeptidase family protein [Agromyces soli]|uniref:M20 family metallopeptidase n=1 Tax=Agromyces soli TaxID=659012 RepID=A0ABY4AVF2_9MICO|nr:M20 family metallopeptidase [Agromyces soli]UOE27162.1 M20 family metallopeptidase [Agromyces soli]
MTTSTLGLDARLSGDESAELRELRRAIHGDPELRFDEHRTGERLRAFLDGIGELRPGVAGTGLVWTLRGDQPGPSILVRADMDAYPVTEESGAPFASRTPGVSHACGHDVHMTVAAGLARRIAAGGLPRGTLTVLFQPAEEIPFGQPSGARAVLDSGALAERYDAVLGLHCWPELEVGSIGIDGEIAMAAKDAFRVEFDGEAAHVAMPTGGRDALVALSAFVLQFYAVVPRRRDASEPVALNIGTASAGNSQSQLPPASVLTGTIRTHHRATRDRIVAAVDALAEGVAVAHGVGAHVTWSDAMPAVQNAPELVARASAALGPIAVTEGLGLPMASEDFALLDALGPGLYLKLGVSGDETRHALHSPRFAPDERAIDVGVDALETIIRDLLEDER